MEPEKQSSIGDILEPVVDAEPSPREDVINAINSKTVEPDNTANGGNESNYGANPIGNQSGDIFNPAIHESNPDGTPRLTADGKYRKKRGRKSGTNNSSNAKPASGNPNTTNATDGNPQTSVDYTGMAAMICTVTFGTLSMALGEHWKPSQAEADQIQQQTAKVMEHYGMSDIPPVVGLCIVVGIYAIPRALHPETKKHLQQLGVIAPDRKPVSNEAR